MEVDGHLHTPSMLPPNSLCSTHFIGSQVGTRAGVDTVKKRKKHCALLRIELQFLSYPALANPPHSTNSEAPHYVIFSIVLLHTVY
jgi:hypothetical protein